jgi:hypothetical protein
MRAFCAGVSFGYRGVSVADDMGAPGLRRSGHGNVRLQGVGQIGSPPISACTPQWDARHCTARRYAASICRQSLRPASPRLDQTGTDLSPLRGVRMKPCIHRLAIAARRTFGTHAGFLNGGAEVHHVDVDISPYHSGKQQPTQSESKEADLREPCSTRFAASFFYGYFVPSASIDRNVMKSLDGFTPIASPPFNLPVAGIGLMLSLIWESRRLQRLQDTSRKFARHPPEAPGCQEFLISSFESSRRRWRFISAFGFMIVGMLLAAVQGAESAPTLDLLANQEAFTSGDTLSSPRARIRKATWWMYTSSCSCRRGSSSFSRLMVD